MLPVVRDKLSRYLQHLTLTGYKTLYPVKYSNAVMPSALFHRVNNLIIYKLSSYAAIAPCLDGLGTAAPYFANIPPYLYCPPGQLPAMQPGSPAGWASRGNINYAYPPVRGKADIDETKISMKLIQYNNCVIDTYLKVSDKDYSSLLIYESSIINRLI